MRWAFLGGAALLAGCIGLQDLGHHPTESGASPSDSGGAGAPDASNAGDGARAAGGDAAGAEDGATISADTVLIPAGAYTMLDPGGQTGPLARLTHAFYVDRLEVTVAAFRAWVAAGRPAPCPGGTCSLDPGGPYETTMRWNPSDEAALGTNTCAAPLVAPGNTVDAGDEHTPINCVNWPQAVAICHLRGMRLLTSVEWQYVASGRGEGRTYPWGGAPPADCTQAVWGLGDGKKNGCAFPKPAGAASGDVSRDGVHDLAGGLSEWVFDTPWWSTPTGELVDHVDGTRNGTQGNKLNRGGYYASPADDLRTFANPYTDGRSWLTHGAESIGFRCATTKH